MTISELFKALNLTQTGRNWAEIGTGVSLHLSVVAGQVLWIIVANYKTEGAAWVDLDENTVEALAAVVKNHQYLSDPILSFL
jgi:hypothetical protein